MGPEQKPRRLGSHFCQCGKIRHEKYKITKLLKVNGTMVSSESDRNNFNMTQVRMFRAEKHPRNFPIQLFTFQSDMLGEQNGKESSQNGPLPSFAK